ncbi:hypothetical protein JAAARDRAFT_210090 [Jaapia argillacea MUCL 33604]|uniref:Uncharacterized protein n=1 Tax=Jaapia argillacea MUCL 33604 TaxID=933084 RepID=A0A067PS07_9AGAM|nr:hypothetical protein JAAARDRAFT_210090 [Jaapia argillacea MUCL 33604]
MSSVLALLVLSLFVRDVYGLPFVNSSTYSWGAGGLTGVIVGAIVFLMIVFLVVYGCFVVLCDARRRRKSRHHDVGGRSWLPWRRWKYTGVETNPVEVGFALPPYDGHSSHAEDEEGFPVKSPRLPPVVHTIALPPGLDLSHAKHREEHKEMAKHREEHKEHQEMARHPEEHKEMAKHREEYKEMPQAKHEGEHKDLVGEVSRPSIGIEMPRPSFE